MVVGESRPTFGNEGWQKMIMVLVAQGGRRSPSNVCHRGFPKLEWWQVCAGGFSRAVQRFAYKDAQVLFVSAGGCRLWWFISLNVILLPKRCVFMLHQERFPPTLSWAFFKQL